MKTQPTPRDVVFSDGCAELLRFRPKAGVERSASFPLLLVPSIINRWYVLDLHAGSSVVEALVDAGIDTYCLEWGVAEDEDRYFEWDDLLARLARFVRATKRHSGSRQLGLLGYCMGGTLAAIHTALDPASVAALVNLAGPIDFSKCGTLAEMVDPRWFDPEAIASAGNIAPQQMQSGFIAMRPTTNLAKMLRWVDRMHDRDALERTAVLESWATDNVPFPAAAYVTYIKSLYQENALVRGEHYVGGRRVDLGSITCPVLTVTTSRDTICPPPAATALNERSGSTDTTVVEIPGGHVGAVVGSKASAKLYPALCEWLNARLSSEPATTAA